MRHPNDSLSDPLRLAALRKTALLDTPAEESFDRLTRFATRLLNAPVALVSLVDEDRQFFKSQCGLPEPWAGERQTPLSHSFCQHVVASAEPLVIENARQYALVRDSLAIPDLGVEAYLGVPVWSSDGQVLGSLCVIDHEPRSWTAEEFEMLQELAASVMTEIELRTEIRRRGAAEEAQAELEAVIESIPDAVYIGTRDGMTRTNEAGLRMLGFRSLDELKGNIAAVAERTRPRDATSGEPIRPEEGPFARALGGEQVVREMIVRHVQTGEDRVVRAAAAPIRVAEEVRGAVVVTTDLTERKRVEEALRASEARLHALIHASPLPIEALEADGTVTLWNPAAERTFGWTRDEIVGRPNPLIPDGEEEEHVALRERVFGGESLSGVEVQRRRKDGTRIDVRLSTAPLRDPRGVITEGMGVLEDITEQKRVREALMESERRLSTLVRNLPGVVYRSRNDPRWTMEHIGGRTEELLGYAPEELMAGGAVSLVDLIHPDDRDAVWQGVQEALATREPFRLEYRIRTAGGEEKCVWEQGEGVFSPEGELEALEGFITDVTAIRRAEQRERQLLLEKAAREHAEVAQARIRSILESITDGFFAVDEHWHVTYANQEILDLVGKSSEDVLGQRLWDLYPTPPESRFWTEYHRAIREQVAVEFEEHDPNTGLWVQVRAYPHEEGLAVFVRDVTQRKRAEAGAELEHRRLRAVLDALPVGVFVADVGGKIIRTNAASERIWETEHLPRPGSPEEYHVYRAWWPGTGQRLEPREWGMARALGGESVDGQELEIETFRGARKTILNYARPIVNGNGEQVGAVAATVDVTRRKWAEEALHESEARFRLMVESVRDYAIILLDPDGRVVQWNPGAERVKGYAAEEILGRHMSCFYPKEDRDRGKPQRMLRTAAEQGAVEDEGWRVRKDGTYFWGSVVISGMRSDAGELVGFAKITRDLTERHQAEEALHETQLTMETILATSPDIVVMLDLEGRFRWVSPAMRSVLGYDPEEIHGRGMQDLLAAEDREQLEASLRKLVNDGAEEIRIRFAASHRDGRRVPMEARGRAIRNEFLRGLVLVARDVTEQERIVGELSRAKEEAEAASRAKSDLLSRTSHELRTPLNAILGFAQLLALEVELEENRESVEQILGAGNHLLRLVDEVLDIAGAESGQMRLHLERTRIGAALEGALSLLLPVARLTRVELPRSPIAPSDLHVLADPQRLEQVLLNLLSNAIKYNREGGRVDVVCDALEGERVRIEVRDTGPGIPREKLSRLFTPFERAGAEQTQTEGTGLGLALSRALVEAMDGRIGARSTPGEGSTFWIDLPRAPEGAGAQGRSPSEEGRPGTPPVTGRAAITPVVLYVDDVLDNVRLVERILRRARPEVELITAAGGQKGLDLARERRPELILLDLNLPDISGEEVLRALQEDEATREIPVVMISGDALPAQIEQLREAGAADYLTKPFDIYQFLDVVDESLGRREA